MKVLVTGSLGCIGRHLVTELRQRGHDVTGCDLGHSSDDRYVRCDIRHYRQLERLFSDQPFDYVYNLAAEYGRWNGEDYFEQLWTTNAIGTKNVLRLQERHRFRLIQFSSAEVYGDFDGVMTEDVMDRIAIKQMNDYAMTKWVNEMQVLNAAAMSGTESVRVRPVNVYGPGEIYTPYRGVVPRFIHKALRREPYTVYLNHRRIFDYVEDTCRTFANVVDNFVPGEVYNVGGPPEWECEIKTISDLILDSLGLDDALVTYEPGEPFTTRVKTIDSSKAIRDLGHRPQITPDVGIPRTVEWMKSFYEVAV
jgi:dTDP-glucose 4,6-dehydratase